MEHARVVDEQHVAPRPAEDRGVLRQSTAELLALRWAQGLSKCRPRCLRTPAPSRLRMRAPSPRLVSSPCALATALTTALTTATATAAATGGEGGGVGGGEGAPFPEQAEPARDIGRYREMQGDTGRYREIQGDIGRTSPTAASRAEVAAEGAAPP